MTELIAIFRSRSQAIDCNARLRAAGIPARLMNTPREANVGCGLSIGISQNFFDRAKTVIRAGGYSAFYGYYKMQTNYGRTFIGKIG